MSGSGGSRAARRRARQSRTNRSRALWAGGAALALAVIVLPTLDFGVADHHPEPRDGVSGRHVMAAARYESYPRVAQVYAKAAVVPAVLDGIYCYCKCSEHSGHYSLLDCFNTDHAARCDVCLSEAEMAHDMTQDGKTLDQVRSAIDGLYHT